VVLHLQLETFFASDNVLGGRIGAARSPRRSATRGKVYVSNVKPGVSTTD
jgi:ribose transport system substrate-binding protein